MLIGSNQSTETYLTIKTVLIELKFRKTLIIKLGLEGTTMPQTFLIYINICCEDQETTVVNSYTYKKQSFNHQTLSNVNKCCVNK